MCQDEGWGVRVGRFGGVGLGLVACCQMWHPSPVTSGLKTSGTHPSLYSKPTCCWECVNHFSFSNKTFFIFIEQKKM